MDDTFRENVLMGAEYDEELYKQVIEASALTEDVNQLIDGDLTEIGANGINLSGGQKVRLALASDMVITLDSGKADIVTQEPTELIPSSMVMADAEMASDTVSFEEEYSKLDNLDTSDRSTSVLSVVEFIDYGMKYRSDLPLVLQGLSFATRANEKIGIVGRTGAGKSSLTYALMRMVEAEGGKLVIDGIDVSSLGLNDLRSKISIIPQDPVLFEGTIRDNLDPAGEYTDDEVWEAINGVKIAGLLDKPTRDFIDDPDETSSKSGPWVEGVGLNKWVDENGMNFSVGQRQLLNLCRALLWRRKIVVLDEATANVDSETDQIMQEVIREAFKDCTVLTIAHRLNTIMDSDRIIVIDQGQVAEFDTPQNLLANKDSHFTKLVESMKLNHSQLSGN
ncbi:ATPase-like protein [Coemansia sp. Benny D115]|nr:ATPase-like protein [Coemansia sp. Benny D115]